LNFLNAHLHFDERGLSLLHRQAGNGKGLSVESVNILFDAHPEAIRMQDNFGLLPFHYACLVKLYPESILVHCTSV
jgi:hypothetical protein